MTTMSIGIEGALTALDDAYGAASMRAWMEQHRDELLAHLDGRRISWQALCEWFVSVGLTNAKGEAPTIRCAQLTWHRVGKWLERRKAQAAERNAEALRLEAERESERASRDAEIRQKKEAEDIESAKLREKMACAERAAEWQRDNKARLEAYKHQAAQNVASETAAPLATKPTLPLTEAQPDGSHLVYLDLPKVDKVSAKAYLPHDPSLPPVQEGDMEQIRLLPFKFSDLPGYPSHRNYDYEFEWLRDVGHLLWARHGVTETMTFEEREVFRAARNHVPGFWREISPQQHA
ncbi:MAG: hypothetical protein ABF759_14220 [Acetobacter malorum]|uniref:hypothetical protein n=1 Tax=Acetobacter malorum TaxID=178901 RepID=UPI0039ED1FA7